MNNNAELERRTRKLADHLMKFFVDEENESDVAQPATPPDLTYSCPAPPRDVTRAVLLENGFTIKEGHDDLKEYVYAAVDALFAKTSVRVPNPWTPANAGQPYDLSIHTNPDAKAWVDLFVETFPAHADSAGVMHSWFASAMMAMHDHILSNCSKYGLKPKDAGNEMIEDVSRHVAAARDILSPIRQGCNVNTCGIWDATYELDSAVSSINALKSINK